MAQEFVIKLIMQTGPGFPKGGKPLPGMPTPGGANKLTSALGKLGLAVGGLMIARKGIVALREHSIEMAQVGLMAGKTGDDLRGLGHDILDLSVQYGKSASDMRKAAYEVYSAQVPATQALNVLEQSTQAAMAGNAGVTESFRLMSSIIKGYGKDWSEVGDVSDHVFKIIELGQTDMNALAGSMGRVVPIANSLGVGLDELSGFYATFTGVTGDATLVTTQLRATMAAFIKPQPAMIALAKELGYATAEEIVQQNGLDKALKMVIGATDGSAMAVGELIPQIRALPLVLAATGGQADVLTDKIGKMNDRFGVTEKAVADVKKSIGQRMSEIQAKFSATLTRIMELAVPFLEAGMVLLSGILSGITLVAGAFDSLPGFIKPVALILGILTGLHLKYNLVAKATAFWTKAVAVAKKAATIATKIYTMAVRILTASFGPLIIAVAGAIAIFLVWKASAEAARKASNKAIEEENKRMSASGANLTRQIVNLKKLEAAKRGAARLDKTERKALEKDVAEFLGWEVGAVQKASAEELAAKLKLYRGLKARQDAAAADEQKQAENQEARLAGLIEQLKEYDMTFKKTEDVVADIDRAEVLLAEERKKRGIETGEKLKEFLAAEAEATEEMVRLDYEAGRKTLKQYVAHLQAKLNAMKSSTKKATAQELLAQMQLQNEIDTLNAEGFAKEQRIWDMRLAMDITAEKKALDITLQNEDLKIEEKIAAGDKYWSMMEKQTKAGVDTAGLTEEQATEKTKLALEALGIERAEWEQELRDADVEATVAAEDLKAQARAETFQQALTTAQTIGDSIASIYESQKQRQISAVKKLGLSEEEEKKRIAKIEAEYAKKQRTIAAIQKSVKLAQAISNTALGVTQALKAYPPPLSFVLAGLVAAAGAAQIAAIAAQPFYKGGIIRKGEMGFFEGKRDELVMPLQGEGSFEEIAKLRLIPEILKEINSPSAGGGASAPGGAVVQNITNNMNYNGAYLGSDAEAVSEWRRGGAFFIADKIKEANESLG